MSSVDCSQISPTHHFSNKNSSNSLQLPKNRPIDLSLYLVTERSSMMDEEKFLSHVMQAIQGGVTCIQ